MNSLYEVIKSVLNLTYKKRLNYAKNYSVITGQVPREWLGAELVVDDVYGVIA